MTVPDALADITPAEAALVRVKLAEWIASKAKDVDPSKLSPLEWAEANATIVLPTEGRQPFRPYNYQKKLLDDRSKRRIILKARQTGISNAVAIEALHKAITRPDTTELFVSRAQKAASELISYCQRAMTGLKHLPKLTRENQTEIAFANGSRIVSLSAGPNAGRSIAATDAYLDEYAFTQYDAQIYESIIGTLSTGGGLTILSTPNGRANMFYRLWAGLEGGEWSKHEIHWSDCPKYDAAWEARTRASMTRQSFGQEYGCDFLTSGGAVFEPDDLQKCKDGHNPSPEGCDRFITAWDIGRRKDHTVGATWGCRRTATVVVDGDGTLQTEYRDVWHEVESHRCLSPYPVIGGLIEARKRKYGTSWVESNGVGDPLIEFLDESVERFTTTAKSKVQAIQALQLLVQQGRFKHSNEQLDRELNLYQWDDTGLVTDSVMAAAINAHAVQQPNRPGAGAILTLGARDSRILPVPMPGRFF